MNRRDFISKLGLAIGAVSLSPLLDLAPIEKTFDWTSTKIDFQWYGIPYHCSNASTGSWLGFSRVGVE